MANTGNADVLTVRIDTVMRLRTLIDDTTETHLRARDAEVSNDQARPIDVSRHPGRSVEPQLVPSWHAELDRRWQAHRTALLRAHDGASHNLDAIVRNYLACDAAVASSIWDEHTPAVLDEPSPAQRRAVVPASLDPLAPITDLDHAVSIWRRRRDGAADTITAITAALENLIWTGAAADNFAEWADDHLQRWHEMRGAADTIGQALTDPAHPTDNPNDPGPDLPTLTDKPLAPNPAGPTATEPEEGTAGEQAMPPVTRSTGLHDTTTPAHDQSPASTAGADQDGQSRHPGTAPEVRVPAPRAAIGSSGSAGAGEIASALEPGHASMAPRPAVGDDASTVGAATPPSATSTMMAVPAAHSDPPATDTPMVPTAAMAGATALARADRAYHVIREITIPPTPTAPPVEHRNPDGLLSAPHRFRTSGPGMTAPPPPTPPCLRGDPTTAAGHAPATGAPGQAPHPKWPWRSRRRAGRSPMWVNLHPATPQGAWIDLTARPGLGLHGPGATAIARTALRELHAHTPTVLVIPRALLDELTSDPDQPAGDPVPSNDRVHTVEHPYEGLQHLVDITRDQHPDPAQAQVAPCLLVVPAPASTGARDDLARTLRALSLAPAGALLLGHWPHGAGLDIDAEHRVRAHQHPADAGLDYHQLQPTGADGLARELGSNVLTSDRTGVDRPDEAARDDDAEVADPTPPTPLMLFVLGPVDLRYRPADPSDTEPLTPTPAAGGSGRPDGAPINPIPRLARELLAYLAAHPEGATRDHLVEVLCPDSTARRPETTLYAALSRLRRAVTDTTGDSSIDDLIITTGGRWHINPDTVTVDYWTLLTTGTPEPDPARRRRQLHAAITAYRDLFAADLTGTWAHTIRESARRRHLEIINELTELEIQTGHTTTALELLERARDLEPLNEGIYRAIITMQKQADRTDDAKITYELLRAHLATIGAEPDPRTQTLVDIRR